MADFRRVLTNTGWNLVGTLLPLLAALWAMPWLAQRLGTERFGLLALAWVLIGYFGLFEFGIGRALTRFVAERAGRPEAAELPGLCSTATALAALAGLVGGAVVAAAAWWGGGWMSRVPPALQAEVANGLLVIALGIPPTVGTAAFRGMLEGLQRFKLLMAIRVPSGVLLFAAPCLTAAFSPRLDWALASIVLTRWLVLLVHAVPCRQAIAMSWQAVRGSWVGPLLRMGGWLTVSNVVSPVIVYADRFVIGGLLSAVAVAHYAAPFEMVSRLLVLPVALAGALFPALAAAQSAAGTVAGVSSASAGALLRRQATLLTLAVVLPLALIGGAYATPLLAAWMGPEFAEQGSAATRILLLGFVFNAVAHIPFAALHGYGLARQTALLHLLELPLYLAGLVWLVQTHGIEGAATAWAARALLDLLALLALLARAERQMARDERLRAAQPVAPVARQLGL